MFLEKLGFSSVVSTISHNKMMTMDNLKRGGMNLKSESSSPSPTALLPRWTLWELVTPNPFPPVKIRMRRFKKRHLFLLRVAAPKQTLFSAWFHL